MTGYGGLRDTGPGAPGPCGRASAVYDGGPESIAAARGFAAGYLRDLRAALGVPVSAGAIGTAQLVVSELVTNACKYAPGPCLVDCELVGGSLEIAVWDSDPALPLARAPRPGRIGQHGLEIVLAVCDGFDVRREPVGKRIKVRLPVDTA
ncbi:ATP-binding protein [Streptomyces fuscigenes]|nr:ATP-binding protein [Streptomyces fuscigenes]MCF3965291.1 ATP-binding protein [Streptomyces fuscigenes]